MSYCYDELHRVTGKGYGAQSCPLATPVVTYAYDSGANAIGKLTSLTDQAGTASYTYDILGRLTAETRTLTGRTTRDLQEPQLRIQPRWLTLQAALSQRQRRYL